MAANSNSNSNSNPSSNSLPRYPVYVPSKGRFTSGYTIKFLKKDKVPFFLVVEPQEKDEYGKRYGYDNLLVLPWSGNDEVRQAYCKKLKIENGGLIAVRNWIRDHSISLGFERHWQLDDNILEVRRRLMDGRRIPCNSGPALALIEDFTDRYENVGISGMNYYMFAAPGASTMPFMVNHRVYSCSLINNKMPYIWRLAYNDDTDICLQLLANGWCTLLVNAVVIQKLTTMLVSGGNTTDLYQGDGRLKMSRSLERIWPGVVTTTRRFRRPQHHVNWNKFDNKLIPRPGLVIPTEPNDYGFKLVQIKEVKTTSLQNAVKGRLKNQEEEKSSSSNKKGKSDIQTPR
jgi:hypothetical protein